MASYYYRFIKVFSQMSLSLTKLIRKNALFIWTSKCEKSFQELKEKLTSTSMLMDHLRFTVIPLGEFRLCLDAKLERGDLCL